MTLEIVDKSDVIKGGNKERKSGLQLLDESDIKKVGNKKESWSDIIEPKIELVDKSDTRKASEKVKKSGLEFVAKERIINCERQIDGMTNNCVLCNELTKDRFDRCPNKYG